MALLTRAGDLIAGRYRIERPLGEGGMGIVFEATHLQLGQRVAIKFLLPDLCAKPEAVERFLHEARAAVKLESEHVARVMDVGSLESGEPYMVMEHLEGSDLSEVLRQQGRLPMHQAVDYVLQSADAIAEAHSLGIIHRDLKPSNLFLARRRDGSSLVKVLDFGISKALVDLSFGAPGPRTASAMVMGSPLYMSPEQVRSSKTVDPRSDIWSLGIILHELLVGEPPFQAETLPGILATIVADAPIPLRARRPDAPVLLEAIILRCLQKDRIQRFALVSELADALAPFATRQGRRSLARIASFGPAGRSSEASQEPESRQPLAPMEQAPAPLPPSARRLGVSQAVSRERRKWYAIVSLVIAAAVLGIYAAAPESRPHASSHPAAAGTTPLGAGTKPLPEASEVESPGSVAALDESQGVTRTALGEARWRELEQAPAGFVLRPPATLEQREALLEERR